MSVLHIYRYNCAQECYEDFLPQARNDDDDAEIGFALPQQV